MPVVALAPLPKIQFFDNNGLPLSLGKVYTYQTGTTTPLATYTDSTGGSSNANPVVLDAYGRANIWIGPQAYTFSVTTASGTVLYTIDGISAQNMPIQAAIHFAAQAAPSAGAGDYYLWADSTGLRLKMVNNGTTDTVVGQNTTDTLTNKTLTSPTITSPTITSPTITGTGTAALATVTAANINSIIILDGVTYAQTAAGLNAAITAANAAGGGHVIVPVDLTVTAGIILKSNVYVHMLNDSVITAGAGLAAGTTIVTGSAITDAGFWGVIDGASLTNVADGFDLTSSSRFHGSIDVRNTGKRAAVSFGVQISACTDCYIDLIRIRNHGEGTNGTTGLRCTGSSSNVVIDLADVDGTICQGGNGNVKIDGSGIHLKHVISTNQTGPVGNLQSGDGFFISGTDNVIDVLELKNANAATKGAAAVSIQYPAARNAFGMIYSYQCAGNAVEVGSSADGAIQDIYIGTIIAGNTGMGGGALSNQAAFEIVGNGFAIKNISVGTLHSFDNQGGATTKYGAFLQQVGGGSIDSVRIGSVYSQGHTSAVVSTSGTVTNFSYNEPIRLYSTSSDAAGLALRLKSSAASGRDWAIGSNFVTGAGDWSLYDYTATKERQRVDSTGISYFKRISGTLGTPVVAGDFALHANWGTGATVTAVTGTDQGWNITVTAAGTPGASPTIILTFKDGTWTNSPIGISKMVGGTGTLTTLTDSLTATAWTITFQGTPGAGSTYIISGIVMGR